MATVEVEFCYENGNLTGYDPNCEIDLIACGDPLQTIHPYNSTAYDVCWDGSKLKADIPDDICTDVDDCCDDYEKCDTAPTQLKVVVSGIIGCEEVNRPGDCMDGRTAEVANGTYILDRIGNVLRVCAWSYGDDEDPYIIIRVSTASCGYGVTSTSGYCIKVTVQWCGHANALTAFYPIDSMSSSCSSCPFPFSADDAQNYNDPCPCYANKTTCEGTKDSLAEYGGSVSVKIYGGV